MQDNDNRSDPAWPTWLHVLCLGLVLAISAYVQFSVVTHTTTSLPMASDSADYFSYAYNLKHSGTYSSALSWTPEPPPGGITPDSLRSPGYPLFLLAIPGLDATSAYLKRVSLVQAGLGVGSVLLVFLLASRVLRPGWSHAAALATAISPHLANMSTYLLTEGLFLFLLLASLLVSLAALRSRSRKSLLLGGVLWGLCTLVRPTVMFVVPLFLLATIALPRLRHAHFGAAMILVGFLLVQLPWLVRNQVTTLDTSQGSLMVGTLHHGSYPNFMYEDRPETLGWPFRYDPTSVAAERDLGSVLVDIAGKFRREPALYAHWYLLGKPGTFLSWGYVQGEDIYVHDPVRSPYKDEPLFAGMRLVAMLMHWPLMLLGVCSAIAVWWRPRWLALEGDPLIVAQAISAVVLYAIAFHIVAAPYPRYGVPFRPLITVLALALASAPFVRKHKPTEPSLQSA